MPQVTDRYGGKGRIDDNENVVKARMPVIAVFTCTEVEQNVMGKKQHPLTLFISSSDASYFYI